MKKRMVAMGLAALLCVALVGCANKSEPAPVESSMTEAEKTQQKIQENFKIDNEEITLPQLEAPKQGDEIVVVETTLGNITLLLFTEQAPEAVKSFRKLANEGYYNGQKFEEIVENYRIESGIAQGTSAPSASSAPGVSSASSASSAPSASSASGASASPGNAQAENEYSLELWHFRGAVGFVSSADGIRGNRFYIIQNNGLTQDMMEQMEKAGFPAKVREQYKKSGGAPWLDAKNTIFAQVIEGMDVVDAIVETRKGVADVSSSASSSSSSSSAASSQAPVDAVITRVVVQTYTGDTADKTSQSSSAVAVP